MLNTNEARVADPVLSTYARGFRENSYVGSLALPIADVAVRGGKTLVFGKEAFQKYALKRAPGTAIKRVDFGYSADPYRLMQEAVDVKLPVEIREEAQRTPDVEMGMRAAALGMRIVMQGMEVEQAALVFNAANYPITNKATLTGSRRWDDYTASTPIKDVDDAKEAVRSTIGAYPNAMIIGAKAWPAIRNHPHILDRVKYTSAQSITEAMLAGIFGLDRVAIGSAVTSDDKGTFSDVWGPHIWIGFARSTNPQIEQPSFGYTYSLQGYPMVTAPWLDKSVNSWMYGVFAEYQPIITGAAAGFLYSTVVS